MRPKQSLTKHRKKCNQLAKEIREMEAHAYKNDGNENIDVDRFNSKYFNKVNELRRLNTP